MCKCSCLSLSCLVCHYLFTLTPPFAISPQVGSVLLVGIMSTCVNNVLIHSCSSLLHYGVFPNCPSVALFSKLEISSLCVLYVAFYCKVSNKMFNFLSNLVIRLWCWMLFNLPRVLYFAVFASVCGIFSLCCSSLVKQHTPSSTQAHTVRCCQDNVKRSVSWRFTGSDGNWIRTMQKKV